MSARRRHAMEGWTVAATVACLVLAWGSMAGGRQVQRTFATPEDAVRALSDSVASGNLDEVVAIFGPDGADLIDSSDPVTARRNREVFTVAFKEGWRLVDGENHKTLVIGYEGWDFPVPLVKGADGWQFDTAAGKEEVLARRIGRNELAVVRICRAYVSAQRAYASRGHDGKPPGLYARRFRSDSGTENGLYWVAARGAPRSPLGELVSDAADERRSVGGSPTPFHGYHFRIVTAQGPAAPGGEMDYLAGGELSRGFALVAWPAQYDVTGIMTFIVNQDGIVHESDLGPAGAGVAAAMTRYNPDPAWAAVD